MSRVHNGPYFVRAGWLSQCLLAIAMFVSNMGVASAEPGFDLKPDTTLKGGAKKTIKKAETFACLTACLEEESFACKAVAYTAHTQECRLSASADAGKSQADTDLFVVTDDGKGSGDTKCFSGGEKSGALCYKKCKPGYVGRGPVCWEKCPAGYQNDGATCRKPVEIKKRESKGRGAGKPLGCSAGEERDGALCYPKCKDGYNGVGPVCWQKCPSGFKDDGATCRDPGHIFGKKSYGRGVGKVLKKNCSGDCEKDAGLWYKKCQSGYNGRGPVCWQTCPSGYTNDGATCRKPVKIDAKKSYGRGAGKPLHACGSGFEKDGGLCYPKCQAGYNGVGPVCWKSCPAGFKTDGATCRKPGKIVAKKSYGRGAGYLQRGNYRRIFHRYIRDHYNVNKAYGKPLTAAEKAFLAPFFPKKMIDDVRVVMKKNRTGFGNYKAGATTYDNLIVIKEGHRTNTLLKHELVHVCQYQKLGQQGFAYAYADQYVDSGYNYDNMSFEQDAFGFSTGHISAYLGANNARGAIYSSCK